MIFIVFYHINVFYIVIFHHLILFSKSILRNNSEIPKLILRQKKNPICDGKSESHKSFVLQPSVDHQCNAIQIPRFFLTVAMVFSLSIL